jgi:hypothetical protein
MGERRISHFRAVDIVDRWVARPVYVARTFEECAEQAALELQADIDAHEVAGQRA